MKKIIFIAAIAAAFMFTVSSCSKTNDAPDLTASIVGDYSGILSDSVVGAPASNYSSDMVTVSKVDNSHVQVTGTSNPPAYFIPTTYTVTFLTNGNYSLTLVPSASSGTSITSAATYFNITTDGGYATATRSIYATAQVTSSSGTLYQVYQGSH